MVFYLDLRRGCLACRCHCMSAEWAAVREGWKAELCAIVAPDPGSVEQPRGPRVGAGRPNFWCPAAPPRGGGGSAERKACPRPVPVTLHELHGLVTQDGWEGEVLLHSFRP